MQVLQTIMVIIEVIKLVESLITESGHSADKLSSARAILESIYGDLSANWATYEKVIGGLVKIYNATGVFKKS